MAITLESIAAPGATPITRNAASSKSFANDFFKLSQDNISTRQRKAISALGLIYELTAAGGANYKSNHAGLIQDSRVYSGGLSKIDLPTAMAALEWNAGNVADATLSTDVPTLVKEGRDFAALAELELDRILIFLRAQLRR
jgi:hypothetical protein